ncbi:MAG: DUF1326 domain-containing protein [Armatimonadetes bacterium]|nr:MAG: DUF1326 domain-containing protein [Armatimonadota bacterium]
MILYAAIAAGTLMTGTYFEARTCSVFAGPCHVSGEIVTDGRIAVVAVNFESGELAGKSAAAVIRSDQNLAFHSPRRSVLYVDASASPSQREQLKALLTQRSRIDFGSVVATEPARVRLDVSGKNATVRIEDASGRLLYAAQTSGRECLACSMPGELWYQPLGEGVRADVATVEEQALYDSRLGETFVRKDEAAAFVGRFAW